jgi:membrane protease YdiL (CAAX protease family)
MLPTASGFPVKSLVFFISAVIVLRGIVVLAWAFFPGAGLFPHVVRVTVPLFVAVGLLALNQRLLAREGFPQDALGLNARRFGWFFAGGFIIALVILLIAGELWLLAPFHWARGSLTWAGLSWQTAEYFGGNLGEELAFRGYLLLLLTRRFRLTGALFIIALLFGLFHLPGLSAWTMDSF